MAHWDDLERAEPALAAAALPLFLLDSPGGGLGYLATVRPDGGPRVHPISPVLLEGRLYAFVLRRTPKCRDLLKDERYALHSWPRPFEDDVFDDEELFIRGRARRVAEPEVRTRVAAATGDEVDAGEVFELELDRVMHKTRRGGLRYEVWPVGV